MTKGQENFDSKVEKFEERVEKGVRNWIQNDKGFDGFRNTPARVLLAVLTYGVLFGFGALALFNQGDSIWWYIILLALIGTMQKISVRFVFDDEELVDEYQAARRNKAYRHAYKRIGLVLGILAFDALAWAIIRNVMNNIGLDGQTTLYRLFESDFETGLSLYSIGVISVFIVGLFSLQKYLSWGVKGEPWGE